MSLEHVQEGIAWRHRPWNTPAHIHTYNFRHGKYIREVCSCRLPDYSQGLAPSATISMRREDRLMSFWSRWAIIAQWRSRHFTRARRAVCNNKHRHLNQTNVLYWKNINNRSFLFLFMSKYISWCLVDLKKCRMASERDGCYSVGMYTWFNRIIIFHKQQLNIAPKCPILKRLCSVLFFSFFFFASFICSCQKNSEDRSYRVKMLF